MRDEEKLFSLRLLIIVVLAVAIAIVTYLIVTSAMHAAKGAMPRSRG